MRSGALAAGTPLDGATVHLLSAAGDYLGNTTTSGGASAIDVPAGTYRLFVLRDDPGYPDKCVGGLTTMTAPRSSTSPGGSTTADITLAGL